MAAIFATSSLTWPLSSYRDIARGALDQTPLAEYGFDWNAETDLLAPGGPDPAVVSGCPGLDSAKRSSLGSLPDGG
jgi:hypothetical protein